MIKILVSFNVWPKLSLINKTIRIKLRTFVKNQVYIPILNIKVVRFNALSDIELVTLLEN